MSNEICLALNGFPFVKSYLSRLVKLIQRFLSLGLQGLLTVQYVQHINLGVTHQKFLEQKFQLLKGWHPKACLLICASETQILRCISTSEN